MYRILTLNKNQIARILLEAFLISIDMVSKLKYFYESDIQYTNVPSDRYRRKKVKTLAL